MEGVALLDSEGRYTYINEAHARIYGFNASELVGRSWKTLYDADQIAWIESEALPALQSKGNWHGELIGRMNRGTPVHVEVGLQRLPQSAVLPEAFMCTCRDITIRKQTEAVLRQAHGELEQRVDERTAQLARANRSLQDEIAERKRVEDRLRTTQYAVDHAADQIFVIGPNGYFLDVNESACRRLGYTKEELLTMSVTDIDPDFPPGVWDEVWADLTRVGQLRLETRHRSKSGEIYPVEVVANYLCHDGQELDYAIVRDITERKRNEAALLESEERFSKAFNESAIGMAIVATDGRWLQVNQALCEIVGYSKAELEASTFQAITHPDDLDAELHRMHQMLNGELRTYQMEKRYFHKNGSVIWIVLNVSLVRNADGTPKHFIAQIQDITDRKRIQDRLLTTQYAVDHAADQIFIIAPDGPSM
jgi:PAS domain S-box-containing protein